MSEPYEDWLAKGELLSDAHVGCKKREDGHTIDYALFDVDPDKDDDAVEGLIESLPDDLDEEGCECLSVRVALIRTDEGSVEVAKDQWHSDEDCPAN